MQILGLGIDLATGLTILGAIGAFSWKFPKSYKSYAYPCLTFLTLVHTTYALAWNSAVYAVRKILMTKDYAAFSEKFDGATEALLYTSEQSLVFVILIFYWTFLLYTKIIVSLDLQDNNN